MIDERESFGCRGSRFVWIVGILRFAAQNTRPRDRTALLSALPGFRVFVVH